MRLSCYPISQPHHSPRSRLCQLVGLLGEAEAESNLAMMARDLKSFADALKHDAVRAAAAAALAVLSRANCRNQDRVREVGGIAPLVALLRSSRTTDTAKEEAAAALWSLSSAHFENQVGVADAGGIAPLVAVIGLDSERAQEQAAGALAALALDNMANRSSIAELIVALLGSQDKHASAKAARAISTLAKANPANQVAVADAGGLLILVSLLDARLKTESESAFVRKEMAAAIWCMAFNNPDNQRAVADAGGIPKLIALFNGDARVHREAAGALWNLAGNPGNALNQQTIADAGGIGPLVTQLKVGSVGAQETAAGALFALAESDANRVAIASAGGIPLLVALLEIGSDAAKAQAAAALERLVLSNPANQRDIAVGLVSMLANGSASAQEHVTVLLRNLSQDPENRASIAKAGAVPQLVHQLECGSAKAMGMAASGLALIALQSKEHRATVTQELVKLLASDNESVRQRASEALRDMAAGEKPNGQASKTKSASTGGAGQSVGLVNLLKDGLKDDNIEAQEYASSRWHPPFLPFVLSMVELSHDLLAFAGTPYGRSRR